MKQNNEVDSSSVNAPFESEQRVQELQARIAELSAVNAEHLRELRRISLDEGSLRESEARYRTIFENSDSATMII